MANFGHYNRTYGTLGGIIAFLFFVYVGAAIMLLGAEVAKAHLDLMSWVMPATEPEGPKRRWTEQIWVGVRGLFVDVSPHHDTSVPYEPGRDVPLDPGRRHETDQETTKRP